ncbi:hypothetical protein AVEN_182066-1 [Araneus ventricosus]|uniref:Uncharacterized protein n=1 Tax=Araneus ventricosus TaxID=182803 RepID=A0A4Y2NTQ6_ARAVE|nr:hypothetical protein AVEN_182066-1 [Araneus ventricosus]
MGCGGPGAPVEDAMPPRRSKFFTPFTQPAIQLVDKERSGENLKASSLHPSPCRADLPPLVGQNLTLLLFFGHSVSVQVQWFLCNPALSSPFSFPLFSEGANRERGRENKSLYVDVSDFGTT